MLHFRTAASPSLNPGSHRPVPVNDNRAVAAPFKTPRRVIPIRGLSGSSGPRPMNQVGTLGSTLALVGWGRFRIASSVKQRGSRALQFVERTIESREDPLSWRRRDLNPDLTFSAINRQVNANAAEGLARGRDHLPAAVAPGRSGDVDREHLGSAQVVGISDRDGEGVAALRRWLAPYVAAGAQGKSRRQGA